MSQHDMDIVNASGAALRADINLALKALVSLNSGPSAPATTYVFQLWPDTTNDLLKMRNAANTAWISVLKLSTGAPVASSPTGSIITYGASTPPDGYLECDGSAISRATYADLFAVIGVNWGAGDGSTTFNIPDLRGEFLRGWDNGRAVDAGRAFASWQNWQLSAHIHSIPVKQSPIHYLFNQSVPMAEVTPDSTAQSTSTGGTHNGSESRPRNIATMFCIKY